MEITPLFEWHTGRQAMMKDFRGWKMPLWYPSGAVAEHRAVVTNAGLFDTSHMSVVLIKGPESFSLLQRCFTRDLRRCSGSGKGPLRPGRSVYGAYLNEAGGVVDDTILYMVGTNEYISIVNSGMGGPITAHLNRYMDGARVDVADLSGNLGKIDIQGPFSAKVMKRVLVDPGRALQGMRYFQFRGHFDGADQCEDIVLIDGTKVLISRTGYTGEFGFEILVERNRLLSTWEMIMDAGSGLGLIPCGLAARDSLRVGAGLPLSQQDIGPWPFVNHPWHKALPYNEARSAFTKRFVGDEALKANKNSEFTYAMVGYDPRKVSTHDPAVVLDEAKQEIGVVLTCVADMAIGRQGSKIYSMTSPDRPEGFRPKGLMCGFVKVTSPLSPGRMIELRDKKRTIKATIVEDIRPNRTALRPMSEML